MGAVVQSLCAIALLIAVGRVAARSGALGSGAPRVLADLTYWITSPALLFSAISATDVHRVMGAPLAVAAASGLGTAIVVVLVARVLLGVRGGDLVLGAMSGSLNNAAHIGIPIAVYALGDAVHGVPIMVFQLGFFTPMFFVLADLAGSHAHPTVSGVVRGVVTNPMVLAAAAGFACAWWRIPLPELITVATTMAGQAAPPVVLVAFGASLVGQSLVLRGRRGVLIVWASIAKLVVQPAIALGAGHLLGLRGGALMAVTVVAALPTAQNAFIAATRARTGEDVAKAAVLLTTFASLPVTALIAWAFHAGGLA